MKVVNFLTVPDGGGAENLVADLSREIQKNERIRFKVACLSGSPPQGSDCHSLRLRSPQSPLAVCEIAKYLKKEQPDIVHCHLAWDQVYVAAALALFPLRNVISVASVHSTKMPFSGKSVILKPLDYSLYRQFDCVVAVSRSVSEVVRSLDDDGKRLNVRIIDNGSRVVDENLLRGVTPRNLDKIRLVSVGRIEEGKNYGLALDIAGELRSRGIPFHYRIVGDGSKMGWLKDDVSRRRLSQHIDLVGWTRDVERHLRESNLFLMTSRYEGFGLALLEAMAVGLPAVVNSIPSLREILGPSREAGAIMESSRPSDYVDVIQDMFRTPMDWQRRSMAAAERARNYTIRECANKHVRLYSALLSGKIRGPRRDGRYNYRHLPMAVLH